MSGSAQPRAGIPSRVGTIVKALLMWPARIAAARQVLRQTSSMSDAELRDIGLSRQDVRDATALPLGADPGRLFQARVHERIEARQAVPFVASPPTVPDLPAKVPPRAVRGRRDARAGRIKPAMPSLNLR